MLVPSAHHPGFLLPARLRKASTMHGVTAYPHARFRYPVLTAMAASRLGMGVLTLECVAFSMASALAVAVAAGWM